MEDRKAAKILEERIHEEFKVGVHGGHPSSPPSSPPSSVWPLWFESVWPLVCLGCVIREKSGVPVQEGT